MRAFFSVLSEIPKELWTPIGTLSAGIFTALVAFGAVMLQNRSAERRHRAELEHDARQRNVERLAELRKLVYLKALDDLAALGSAVGDFWNMQVPVEELKQRFEQLKGSTARLTGVADIRTIQALEDANLKVMQLLPGVLGLRFAMGSWQSVSEQIKRTFDNALQNHSDVVKRLKEEPALSAEQRKDLESERDRLLKFAKDIGKQALDDISARAEFQVKALVAGQQKLREFNRAMSRVTVEIRRELGFHVDESKLLALIDASSDTQHETMVSALQKMRDTMSKHFESQTI